jgi:hypothetical protein
LVLAHKLAPLLLAEDFANAMRVSQKHADEFIKHVAESKKKESGGYSANH